MSLLLALAFLVVCGGPPAYAVTRQPVVAVVVAPLATGLVATVAAVAMLVVGGPFALWLLVATAAGWGLAALLLRRPRAPLPGLDVADAAVMYAPLLLPALLARRPPVAWDARSIWWFHATWIDQGAAAFRGALDNPALAFSHPDYPPFAPATIAGAWTVGGGGLRVAQVVSTVLTLAAVALLAWAVRHLVGAAPAWVARLVGLGVALGLWSVADYGIAGGYVDHLWAAAVATGAVLLFVDGSILGPGGRTAARGAEPSGGHLALAVLVLAVAALTKNEGFVAVVLVALLFTVRARHRLRLAAWVWVPVLAGGAWSVVARRFGATSDLSSSPRITQLVHGDLEPLERVRPTVDALVGHVGWAVAGALVVTVIGLVALRVTRQRLGLASILWPWALAAAFAAALVATYVISPYGLQWHLLTSADRVGVLLVLLSLAIVASWVLVAAAPEDPGDSGFDDDRARGASAGRDDERQPERPPAAVRNP